MHITHVGFRSYNEMVFLPIERSNVDAVIGIAIRIRNTRTGMSRGQIKEVLSVGQPNRPAVCCLIGADGGNPLRSGTCVRRNTENSIGNVGRK